jgi:hypothetical protein
VRPSRGLPFQYYAARLAWQATSEADLPAPLLFQLHAISHRFIEMLIPVPRTCSLSYLPAVLRRYRPDLTLATVPYMNRLLLCVHELETEM